jgi:hypothetical protein
MCDAKMVAPNLTDLDLFFVAKIPCYKDNATLQRKHDISHYKKIKHDILHYKK